MKILVTGCAGFIGAAVCRKILEKTDLFVVGVDNLNSYYDVELKNHRLSQLSSYSNFSFCKLDISNKNDINKLFAKNRF